LIGSTGAGKTTLFELIARLADPTAGEVIVEARVSRTGNALAQPGDLFGRSGPIKPGATGLRITIDQVMPNR